MCVAQCFGLQRNPEAQPALCDVLCLLEQVTDPAPLLDGSIASFQNGVVARGHITVQQPGVDHTCTIGGSAAGTTCTCKPAATCAQDATCFGSLCDYSKVSLAPSTAYKVRTIVLLSASKSMIPHLEQYVLLSELYRCIYDHGHMSAKNSTLFVAQLWGVSACVCVGAC